MRILRLLVEPNSLLAQMYYEQIPAILQGIWDFLDKNLAIPELEPVILRSFDGAAQHPFALQHSTESLVQYSIHAD